MEHYALCWGRVVIPQPPQNLVPKQLGIQSPLLPLAASSVLAVFEWLGCLTNVAEHGSWLHFLFPTGP